MIRPWLMLMLACAVPSSQAAGIPITESVMQLTQELDALDQEARDGNAAALERLQARQAIDRLQTARAREQQAALDEAQVLLKTAEYSVKASQLKDQLVQLDRERDAIMVEASRRDAALARKEAERLRLQALAREEEQSLVIEPENGAAPTAEQAATASATGEQARRVAEAKAKEAELARLEEELSAQMNAREDDYLRSRTVAGKTIYTLSATAFAPGKPSLTSAAKQVLGTLSKKLKSSGKAWLIEGHLDAVGDEAVNLQFSRKRADSVLSVLKSSGVPASKLSAKGLGSGKPVAPNNSKSGRAQNRRIEIIQK
ncbi:MAG: OmpA family protein [Arenimonas sp.]|nr:OmpA family protein [Arenimonas sp.]